MSINKEQFNKYMAERYGIDFGQAESFTSMFTDCLQDFISAGQSVTIDEIGEFIPAPLFPSGLDHKNNIALARAAKKTFVTFHPSKYLTRSA